ncbi:heme exporter protein CcmD [Thiomicrospira microaerophila]|jgi:heme exporter protein D|uniref:heme exporter protein CcmD n=1 Tax=Thiomicrospira microaerophila TaxID=406020 RepID=UPI0009FD78E8|nr:heme exporter protein CcmD [Thiomicrospira microaerophila]
MSEFFSMGGYGAYVWSSVGLSLLVMGYNLLIPYWRHQRLLQSWRQQQQEEARLHESG